MSTQNNGDTLYQKREPIHPRSVKGKFRTFKSTVLLLAFGVFFLLPWIPWERPGNIPNQAVLFDIPNRIYYIFNLPVHIQNIMWLAGVLILFALALFFVTAVLGRVFCGYFCFQTLWTDAFIFIESWIQGNRNARLRLQESEWNREKIIKVGGTWLAWFIFAFWSGFTFTAYWTYAPQLLLDFFVGKAPFAAYVTTALLTITTFTMAGFAREQVCTFMCPYARFQGVMFDADTLIVSYDVKRGEREKGRAKPMRDLREYEARKEAGYGDCIDCNLCVQVCPAGIDIRDGINYKCITCGLCIDACHNVMSGIKYPTGLIRYDSERGLAGGKTNYFSPRNIGYAVVMIIVTTILLWSVFHREVSSIAIEHERRGAVVQSTGWIQNGYDIKLNNKSLNPQRFEITLDEDPAEYQLRMRHSTVELPSGSNGITLGARVQKAPHVETEGTITFKITVTDQITGEVVDEEYISTRFDDK